MKSGARSALKGNVLPNLAHSQEICLGASHVQVVSSIVLLVCIMCISDYVRYDKALPWGTLLHSACGEGGGASRTNVVEDMEVDTAVNLFDRLIANNQMVSVSVDYGHVCSCKESTI